MTLTGEKIKSICPTNKNPNDLATALNKILSKYEITTVNRVAGFLAQCGHESLDFTVLKENLNYSADALLRVFPKYFKTKDIATAYARNPEKIANRVYGGRMGNGPEASGDGWRFRGMGAIQLTGKQNYTAFAQSIGKTIEETVAYLATLEGAIESACWYWKTRSLNAVCDTDDIITMTKKINGGTHGLDDRKKRYEKAKSVLKA